MSKFNVKKEPLVPTEVNKMGSPAFKLDPREELVSSVLTTFVQKSYYESENAIVNRIKKALAEVDPLFVAKLALYARREANMRSSSHLLAGELAPRISGQEWAGRFYTKVLVRPDDMAEILSYYRNVMKQKAIPNAMRRGFKAKLESLDAYLIDKYKMDSRDISLTDLVNLIRPVPTQANSEAFRLLMKEGGKGLDKLYGSKILEKEMSKAGKDKSSKTAVKEAKKEAIEDTLANVKGMPIFNLLRNLRNIVMYAPDSVDEAIRQLTNEQTIRKSRLLPFRFLSAYNEINMMTHTSGPESAIMFESDVESGKVSAADLRVIKVRVLAALEKAIELACYNIPELEGRTAILIDHSGSMTGDRGGGSLVSAFSKVTSTAIANLFAAMLLTKQPDVYVGMFGDRLLNYKVKRGMGIMQMVNDIHDQGDACGKGTEHGIFTFFRELVEQDIPVDNIIVFSDMVIGEGCRFYGTDTGTRGGSFPETFRAFRRKYPHTKVASVDIRQTDGTTVFNKNLQVTQVAGWSDKIFDVISAGTAGYKALIEEIEKIVI